MMLVKSEQPLTKKDGLSLAGVFAYARISKKLMGKPVFLDPSVFTVDGVAETASVKLGDELFVVHCKWAPTCTEILKIDMVPIN